MERKFTMMTKANCTFNNGHDIYNCCFYEQNRNRMLFFLLSRSIQMFLKHLINEWQSYIVNIQTPFSCKNQNKTSLSLVGICLFTFDFRFSWSVKSNWNNLKCLIKRVRWLVVFLEGREILKSIYCYKKILFSIFCFDVLLYLLRRNCYFRSIFSCIAFLELSWVRID